MMLFLKEKICHLIVSSEQSGKELEEGQDPGITFNTRHDLISFF